MIKNALIVFSVTALIVTMVWSAGPVQASEPCPWSVTMVGVGKMANGKKKADTWFKGFFPGKGNGVAEKPDWFINGDSVGKAQTYFNTRKIVNSSSKLKTGSNIVKIRFNKPPYKGATFQCTIYKFDWLYVPKGGHKWYSCK
jgi:hypothetical protein